MGKEASRKTGSGREPWLAEGRAGDLGGGRVPGGEATQMFMDILQ